MNGRHDDEVLDLQEQPVERPRRLLGRLAFGLPEDGSRRLGRRLLDKLGRESGSTSTSRSPSATSSSPTRPTRGRGRVAVSRAAQADSPRQSPGLELQLQPIHKLDPPWKIHDEKHGTPLESSSAVNGRVMIRKLERDAMPALVSLSGAHARVLQGRLPRGGWNPGR